MKDLICSTIGLVGSGIAYLVGGWDSAMATLLIFMVVDYVSGLMVAGIFKNSTKTDTGALESHACFKGLCRKGMILVYVLVANRLDMALGIDYIRNCVIIGFIANETISITENAGLMGLPIPKVIKDAIDVLKKKGDDSDENQ